MTKKILIVVCFGLLTPWLPVKAQTPVPVPGAPAPGPDEARAGACCGPAPKVCVVELQRTTKVVYGSVCKEYCVPKCSLLDLFRGCCGCAGGCCGEVRVRQVLTKKVVSGPCKPKCVLKEQAPCNPCPGGKSGPAIVPPR
jgi:hypothetical protein